MSVFFAAVADDDTGATDLAGMLAGQGMRPVLAIDPGAAEVDDCDALIFGAGTRALPPQEAYARTVDAVRYLRQFDPTVLQVKYCSTFDSTAEGNIGQSIDAALDVTGEEFTIALPALPVNGRTTYMGYHFVHRQLLSDSSMKHHPLTPMTSSNLVSHLATQTRRRVGLVAHGSNVGREVAALRESGVNIAILDCLGEADLTAIAEAIQDMALITGSSAPAMALPRVWRRSGHWSPLASKPLPGGGRNGGVLVVAGSCSPATREQNHGFAGSGGRVFGVDNVGDAIDEIRAGRDCLLASPEQILRGAEERLRAGLAEVTAEIVEAARPAGLLIAGGETSGAVMRRLDLAALRVGRNIEPGVPLCCTIGEPPVRVVLKSGNFGGPGFYGKAIAAIRGGGE